MSSLNVLEKGRICQEELDEVVRLALESLKTLMVDYETPVEVRLQVALKIFDLFGGASRQNTPELVVRGIEKNAHEIENNAHQLAGIQDLLKLAVQTKHESIYQTDSQKSRVINH
ncbi:hypothetical protein PN36_09690 [Candidatus Thiomargarita nelsonii]|uniref:Uncharacterized protein n=1 Tax=Candidatus Thiomargarita nelsonii TaxID=1003181 RepID=A0A0A6PMX0_9GAMM|nr:hypothetical protein PN36_09690 [Candidatus Thiomargarita nelsonii]